MHIWVSQAHLVPTEARRRHQIPHEIRSSAWALRIEPGPSGRTISALYSWDIFPPLNYQIKANLYQRINTLSVIIFGFAEDSWIIAYVLQIIRIQCRYHMVPTGCHKNTLIGPASRNFKNKLNKQQNKTKPASLWGKQKRERSQPRQQTILKAWYNMVCGWSMGRKSA